MTPFEMGVSELRKSGKFLRHSYKEINMKPISSLWKDEDGALTAEAVDTEDPREMYWQLEPRKCLANIRQI